MKQELVNGVCGIYLIRHIESGRSYVGQSVDIKRRWKEECRNSDNLVIEQAIAQYGEDAFDFSVLEECSKDLLNQREAYWCNYYNTMTPHGYNESLPGQRYVLAYDQNPVSCYTKDGIYVNTYACARIAEDILDINAFTIRRACEQHTRTAGGLYWRYGHDTNNIIVVLPDVTSIHQKIAAKLSKKVAQIDKNTNQIIQIYPSAIEASRSIGHPSDKGTNIGRACNGQRHTAFGFKWRWVDGE